MDRNLQPKRPPLRGVRAVTTLGTAQFVVIVAGLALLATVIWIATYPW